MRRMHTPCGHRTSGHKHSTRRLGRCTIFNVYLYNINLLRDLMIECRALEDFSLSLKKEFLYIKSSKTGAIRVTLPHFLLFSNDREIVKMWYSSNVPIIKCGLNK